VPRVRRFRAPWRIVTKATEFALVAHIFLFTYVVRAVFRYGLTSVAAASLSWNPRPSLFALFATEPDSAHAADLVSHLQSAVIPDAIDWNCLLVNYTSPAADSQSQISTRQKFQIVNVPDAPNFFLNLRFFLDTSAAAWFYQASDSAAINFANLPSFLSALDQRWKPMREVVAIGGCVSTEKQQHFESGLIFSRFAAMKLLRDLPDGDITGEAALSYLNITLWDATCESFAGPRIFEAINRAGELPGCPNVSAIANSKCRPFLAAVGELVFWKRERGADAAARNISARPRDAMWWMDNGVASLCRRAE